MTVLYSICMVNYNMADTLDPAVRSVAEQLDDRFEIVLVDDGSSDNSIAVMNALAAEFPLIRVVPLKRDRRRKLGETRNVSIREASGEYCLLHIDCDDIYEPHLKTWIEVYHQIEALAGTDILLSGAHINMARRDELLKHGPYINIFRGEDRNMWARFGSREKLWLLDHVDFVTRIPKPFEQRFKRTIAFTVDHMITDFRGGTGFREYVGHEVTKASTRTLKLILFRLAVLPFAWAASKFCEPIESPENLPDHVSIADYREAHKGTFEDLVRRHGGTPDWSRIAESERPIFDLNRVQ